jgi:hypothetical protein
VTTFECAGEQEQVLMVIARPPLLLCHALLHMRVATLPPFHQLRCTRVYTAEPVHCCMYHIHHVVVAHTHSNTAC